MFFKEFCENISVIGIKIMEWGAILIDIADSVAVIVASVVAVWGIDSWRRELRGKKEHDLAEETLALFYQARDLIAIIRNPMGHSGEGATRKTSENETESQKQARDNAYVIFERYEKHQEVFNRIYAMRYRFMALFGKDKEQPFLDLNKIINEIFIAARMLSSLWSESDKSFRDEARSKKYVTDVQKHEAVFWASGKDDEIVIRVNSVIEKIESICEPILRR